MLRQRLISIAFILPVGLALVIIDGWPFYLFIMLIVGLAAWEYGRMFQTGGYNPARPLIIAGALLLVLLRALFGFTYTDLALTGIVLAAMLWHLIAAQHGAEKNGTNLAITLGGILYLGWLGSYLVSLRMINQDGVFWFLLVLPAVWSADAGAYSFGRRFGRHKMAPRVSPGKSWEGYFSGIVTGALGGMLLAWIYGLLGADMSIIHGLALGLILAIVTPAGDLGESMLKREFGLKDTSQIIPGHGGVMDRIDSWLWAATIGYYLIILLK